MLREAIVRSTFRQVLECGSPLPLSLLISGFSRTRENSRKGLTIVPGLFFLTSIVAYLLSACVPAQASAAETNYVAVARIFSAHCLDCHASKDPEGQLVLESFDTLMKGGEIGPAIQPGNSSDSLLVQMIEGRFEKDGKKKIMPPGKHKKLTPEEIDTIKTWVDSGAHRPAEAELAKELVIPVITPKLSPRIPINSLAWSAAEKVLAIGRYSSIELQIEADLRSARTLKAQPANINALAFLPQRHQLFSAGGQPGVAGEITMGYR